MYILMTKMTSIYTYFPVSIFNETYRFFSDISMSLDITQIIKV